MVAQVLWQRVDQTARLFLPAATTLMLGIVAVLPIGLPRWGVLSPPLMLAAVFYWAVVRPDLLPATAAFALGLLQDLLTGAPLGANAFALVLVQWILRSQRRYLANRPFFLLWMAFAPVVVGAALVDWLVYAGVTLSVPPIAEGLVRAALGFVLFPLVCGLVLTWSHRALAED